MTKVESVLQALLEAKKSYKNHIPKALRYKMDKALQRLVTLNLDRDGIVDTDSYIDYIEKTFRRHNPNVLLKYVEWVVMVSVGNLKTTQSFVEIVTWPETYVEILLKYDQYLRRGVDMEEHEKDIYNLLTFSSVLAVIEKYPDPDIEKELLKTREAEITYEDSKLRVVKINTYKAAKHFGSGGRGRSKPWCIAATNGFWTRYRDDGYLWHFIFDKENKKRYTISLNMTVGWNQQNNPMLRNEIIRLLDKFPALDKIAKEVTGVYYHLLRK